MLLPIVVLTMVVDRIYAVADEYGLQIALLRLGWTLAAALVSLLILSQDDWREWLLAFPENHAIAVAIIILFGRYRSRRLADLRWMSWLGESTMNKEVQQTRLSKAGTPEPSDRSKV